jgi:hypothetical protein
VLLPDISLSKGTWEIQGDKIRAPVSMLYGIGETAHEQLASGAPYASLSDFCQSIVSWQKKNITTKETVDKEGNVKKAKVWGRNSLDIGKIHSMLIAGCMDSLFEKDADTSARIDLYHAKMKELYLAEGKKYAKSKKKLPVLDILGRYQAKKAVLPPYGEDLRESLRIIGLPDFLEETAGHMRIRSKAWSKDAHREFDTFDPVIGAKELIPLEASEGYVDRAVRCGVIAYIEDKETFNWGPNKAKPAVKLFTEFGGLKRELVCWPDFNEEIPEFCKDIVPGAIVALVINKSAGREDFACRYGYCIRAPLEKEEVDKPEKKE